MVGAACVLLGTGRRDEPPSRGCLFGLLYALQKSVNRNLRTRVRWCKFDSPGHSARPCPVLLGQTEDLWIDARSSAP